MKRLDCVSAGLVAALLLSPSGCFSPNEQLNDSAGGANDGSSTTSEQGTSSTQGGSTTTSAQSDAGEQDSGDATTVVDPETSDDTATAPTCEGMCVSAAPNGWNGPVVRAPGDLGSCVEPFDVSATAGFSSVDADPAECECECGAPSGGTCATSTTVRVYDRSVAANSSICSSVSATISMPNDTFNENDGQNDGIRVRAARPAIEEPPSCTPQLTDSVPEIAENGWQALCSSRDLPGSCDSQEVCTAPITGGFLASYCIWADGQQDCPASSGYTDRSVFYRDVDDDRGCNACTCGNAVNVRCGGHGVFVAVYNNPGPGATADEPIEVELDDGCTALATEEDVEAGNVAWNSGAPSTFDPLPLADSCTASEGEPTGSAEPADAFTVCCQ